MYHASATIHRANVNVLPGNTGSTFVWFVLGHVPYALRIPQPPRVSPASVSMGPMEASTLLLSSVATQEGFAQTVRMLTSLGPDAPALGSRGC